jgi:hypothetical protein
MTLVWIVGVIYVGSLIWFVSEVARAPRWDDDEQE